MSNSLKAEEIFKELKKIPENQFCFDCKSFDSEWSSVNLGIFLCLNCAGIHRGLGVHISFIRSLYMDVWSPKQLSLLQMGGNRALSDFFDEYDLNQKAISYKYKSRAAYYYRDFLRSKVEGTALYIEKPSLEQGVLEVQEKKNAYAERSASEEQKITGYVEEALSRTKEFGRQVSYRIREINVKDIEDKTKNAFIQAKEKTGKIYDDLLESTKKKFDSSTVSILESYENSKKDIKTTIERSKTRILESYEVSKDSVKEKYLNSINTINQNIYIRKLKSMLDKSNN